MSAFTDQTRFIINQFKVDSESNPANKYTVSEYNDGTWACACRGWTSHVPRRDCKHIWWVKSQGATRVEQVDPMAAAIRKTRKRKGADAPDQAIAA